jgi:hypothetical protein
MRQAGFGCCLVQSPFILFEKFPKPMFVEVKDTSYWKIGMVMTTLLIHVVYNVKHAGIRSNKFGNMPKKFM